MSSGLERLSVSKGWGERVGIFPSVVAARSMTVKICDEGEAGKCFFFVVFYGTFRFSMGFPASPSLQKVLQLSDVFFPHRANFHGAHTACIRHFSLFPKVLFRSKLIYLFLPLFGFDGLYEGGEMGWGYLSGERRRW